MSKIQYCVMDNNFGPVCYCYTEQQAKDICFGLAEAHGIKEPNDDGIYRFVYEDLKDCTAEQIKDIFSALALGALSR